MTEKVGGHAVHQQEARSVPELEHHDEKPDGGEGAQMMQILKVSLGRRGLMLGHGIDEGISRLGVLDEQSAYAGGDGTEISAGYEQHDEDDAGDGGDETHADAELPCVGPTQTSLLPDHLAQIQHLIAEEYHARTELFDRFEGCPADHGHLHRQGRAHRVEQRIAQVDLPAESSDQYQRQRVHAHQVQNEHVSAPRRDHVKVRHASQQSVDPRFVIAAAKAPYPQEVRQRHGAHGHRFVVVSAPHRSHNVRGYHRHYPAREDTAFDRRAGQSEDPSAGAPAARTGRRGLIVGVPSLHRIDQYAEQGHVGILRQRTFVREQSDQQRRQGSEPRGHVTAHVVQ
mmetsp:Transcript_23398/g.69227  ORF Transcript_23398/g.69227 Transcript_23398/m.69227 type:complete len:341 (-) Transcript_23398:407-1429(-)